LKSYTVLRSFNQAMDDEPGRAWDPEELVAIGLAEPVSFNPGAGWEYSNTNTVLAGLIVEQITSQPLAEVLDERLFEPLGMDHTVLPAIDDAAIPEPHPHGYMFGTNVSTLDPEDTVLSVDQQTAARNGTLRPDDYTNLNPSWCWAAGAGISTAEDLATYVEVLVGRGAAQRRAAPSADGQHRARGFEQPEQRRIRPRQRPVRTDARPRRITARLLVVHGPRPQHRHPSSSQRCKSDPPARSPPTNSR
jgi:CubicO group peptidase (beta-lactamase class C family)